MTIVEANKPPTTKDIINWFGAGANNVVQYWSSRSGQWEHYNLTVDTCKSWLALNGDQIQYGFRLTTKSSPIRPEVQAVADLRDNGKLTPEELELVSGIPSYLSPFIVQHRSIDRRLEGSSMCGGFGGEVS